MIPTGSTKDWSYAFYLFGSNSSPNVAGDFGVSAVILGGLKLCTKLVKLQSGHEYDILWEYGPKGSRITAKNRKSDEVIQSTMDWSGRVHLPPENVLHINKVIYSGGGRGHSVLEGMVTDVIEKINQK